MTKRFYNVKLVPFRQFGQNLLPCLTFCLMQRKWNTCLHSNWTLFVSNSSKHIEQVLLQRKQTQTFLVNSVSNGWNGSWLTLNSVHIDSIVLVDCYFPIPRYFHVDSLRDFQDEIDCHRLMWTESLQFLNPILPQLWSDAPFYVCCVLFVVWTISCHCAIAKIKNYWMSNGMKSTITNNNTRNGAKNIYNWSDLANEWFWQLFRCGRTENENKITLKITRKASTPRSNTTFASIFLFLYAVFFSLFLYLHLLCRYLLVVKYSRWANMTTFEIQRRRNTKTGSYRYWSVCDGYKFSRQSAVYVLGAIQLHIEIILEFVCSILSNEILGLFIRTIQWSGFFNFRRIAPT